MEFLHPEFLWLAPLVALPVIIHLLNRIRYRRVRWAAIEFLLQTERRAVRRARLRQWLLMALRMLLLAAALGAMAQPVVRGGLAALLGGSQQVAVLLDASASLSATGTGGPAFRRGQRLAAETLRNLPRGTRATGGAFALAYESPFREPVQDRDAVIGVLDRAVRTGGRGDVPRALRAAAETLARGGGGGTIWLLTDLQASGWRADQPGEWDRTRQALEEAGDPSLLITDLRPAVEANLSIAGVRLTPPVLVEGDSPKLTATVRLLSSDASGAVANVGLFLDGERIDSRVHEFRQPGEADVVFRLPPVGRDAVTGHVELGQDALPADDRFHFLLRPAARLPVLVVDGAPSSSAFEGAADFVALAVEPPEADRPERSAFSARTIGVEELNAADLSDAVAVVLADVARLEPHAVERLRRYVRDGGLLVVFPGERTDVATWNERDFPAVEMARPVEADEDDRLRLGAVDPTSPIVSSLPAEGLDRVLIRRLFRFETNSSPTDMLIQTERGEPFLLRQQVGRGKVYVFAVSAQADFSNFPLTPPFLLTLHRALESHLTEAAGPLAQPVFTELRLELPPGTHQVITPHPDRKRRVKPLVETDAAAADGTFVFRDTAFAGIYRLAEGRADGASLEGAPPIAALNVPQEESGLERVDPATVQALLPKTSVSFVRADGQAQTLQQTGGTETASSSFPLAALALAFLLGETLLAWSIGRGATRRTAEPSS